MFAVLLWISALVVVLPAGVGAAPLPSDENLIENPGFEEGRGETVDGWEYYGDVTWTEQEVQSGDRAMRVAAENSSSSLRSSWFQAPAHARVEVGAWLKAEDIVSGGSYFQLRVTLNAFAEDKETRIRHWDLVSLDGSFDWRHFRSSIIVPPDVAYFRLSIQLSESSGTFWVDDVTVRVVQTLPAVEELNLGAPLVIPQPWQMRATGETLPVGRLGIVGIGSDRRLWQQVTRVFEQMELDYAFVAEGGTVDLYDTLLRFGDSEDAEVAQHFHDRFRDIAWSALDDQGYFLSTTRRQQQARIYIGGNTEEGRFYGFQTLKQLIDPGQKTVAIADIADRPSLSRRGVPVGIQWFRDQEELLDRMASLKMNFAWNQGSFLNEKFWFRWREPLTSEEMEQIERYVERANALFIEPYISIAPRGRDASSPTLYSSDKEIDQVVDKMLVLYDLGVHNFGLAFDDLVNFGQDVLFGQDVDFFDNDIGAAHVYFAEQVYSRLTAERADIQFMVVPMAYDALSHRSETEKAYLKALAQLPDEIGIYSAIERTEGASAAIEFTSRPHMVWDNFWSSYYQDSVAPETVIPLERPAEFGADLISGYSFAPLIPILEDEYLITWRTAANYAWAPERYDADVSFQLAVAQHLNNTRPEDSTPDVQAPVISPDSDIDTAPLTATIDFDSAAQGMAEVEDASFEPAGAEIRSPDPIYIMGSVVVVIVALLIVGIYRRS